jgi:hypothetical protein
MHVSNVSMLHSVHHHCPLNFYSTHSVLIYTQIEELFSQLVTKGWCKLKCCPKWPESLQDPQLKVAQLSKNSITINKLIKFSDTVTKTSISVVVLKTVLLALLQNIFRRLPVNGRNVNKRAAKINSHLLKINKKRICNMCHCRWLMGTLLVHQPWVSVWLTNQTVCKFSHSQKAFLFFVPSSYSIWTLSPDKTLLIIKIF